MIWSCYGVGSDRNSAPSGGGQQGDSSRKRKADNDVGNVEVTMEERLSACEMRLMAYGNLPNSMLELFMIALDYPADIAADFLEEVTECRPEDWSDSTEAAMTAIRKVKSR